MEKLVEICTERIRVRAFTSELITKRYVAWLNDPDVVRYSEQRHQKHSIASCREYFRAFNTSDDLFLAILTNKPSSVHIGNISIAIDVPNLVADIAIMIGDKSFWGSGYGSEAWLIVMRWLLEKAGIRKVTAGTMSVNKPMLKLMKKSGMKIDCIREGYFVWENEEVDMVIASKHKAI